MRSLLLLLSRGRVTVARKAHNLEVVGSTPTPATKKELLYRCFFFLN